MANTLSTQTYRDKVRSTMLEKALRRMLIAEKICQVDSSDSKRIENPYGSVPTASVGVITGTYSVADYTTTDDTLTVDSQVIVAEHVYDFESTLADFNLFASRAEEAAFAVANAIDNVVINRLTEDGTGAYSTAAGGFSSANTPVILSNIASQLAGYSESMNGMFLVVENTDLVGFTQWQIGTGFSFADAALNNGFLTSVMGIDIYVTRSGRFTDGTDGTNSWTNAGHRVAGIKNVATYASPRGVRFEEKAVSGKTGMEVVTHALLGFKLWETKKPLIIDITVTA